MESLTELKKKYNITLERDKKAEEYLKLHEPEECLSKKFKGKSAVDGFNEIAVELSKSRLEIETLLYRNMTDDEIWNGFKV